MNHRLAILTGSTGFIGSHLARALNERDWSLRVTVRNSSRRDHLAFLKCDQVTLDLANADIPTVKRALQDVSHVFHVAGRVSGTPQQLDTVNRLGTDILIRAAAEMAQPPVVILVSSAAAGGPSSTSAYRLESDPPAPVSNYGRSKLAGERAAIAARGDCPLSIVRPGIVFGPGDTEFIRIFRAMTRARVNPMIGDGHQPLSMIEVRDLVDFLLRVAERGKRVATNTSSGDSEAGQGVYNAADPTPLSLRQLGNLVRQAMPELRFRDLPMPVRFGFVVGAISEFGCRLLGKYPTLNRDKIREARAPGWALNVEKSLRELAWEPQRPLPDRLTDTLRHALRAGEL